MTTYQNLRISAAQRFTDPSNAIIGDTSASSIRNWGDYINAAYRDVNRASPWWPWLESSEQTVTVLANTRGIALPTNVFSVNWVYDTTNDKRIIPDQGRGSQYRGGYQLRSTTGEISETFKLRSGNVELYPMVTKDTVLVIECVIFPAVLSANGDLPVFPAVFHENLIDGALAYAYLDDGAFDEYNLLWAKFQAEIKQMRETALAARSETYVPIRDAFWG